MSKIVYDKSSDVYKKWLRITAKNVLSACGYGSATMKEVNRVVKHYKPEVQKDIAKTCRVMLMRINKRRKNGKRAEFYRQSDTGLPAVRFYDGDRCVSLYRVEATVDNPEKLISSQKEDFHIQGYELSTHHTKEKGNWLGFKEFGTPYIAPYAVCHMYLVELAINMTGNNQFVSVSHESNVEFVD